MSKVVEPESISEARAGKYAFRALRIFFMFFRRF